MRVNKLGMMLRSIVREYLGPGAVDGLDAERERLEPGLGTVAGDDCAA
jgi:hypothetical protein